MCGTKSRGCREHRRTSENAQDEILHNSISRLGPNPEVHAEKFSVYKAEENHSRTSTKISYSPPSPHTTTIMLSTPQLSPTKLCQQVEEMKRAWEAWEKEECEREEALLRAVDEEEKQEAERKQWEEEERKLSGGCLRGRVGASGARVATG